MSDHGQKDQPIEKYSVDYGKVSGVPVDRGRNDDAVHGEFRIRQEEPCKYGTHNSAAINEKEKIKQRI